MKSIGARWSRFVWGELPVRSRYAVVIRALRVAYAVARELAVGMLNLRAMSLVFTTLLSLVPLVAVVFSVLKGFGVHNQVQPLLLGVLAPLGANGVEIAGTIIAFVDKMQVGVLGSVGLALLLYNVVSMIQKVESAFNFTWRVTQTRSWARRFSDYMSVIFIGPLLVLTALGLTASVENASLYRYLVAIAGIGWVLEGMSLLLPYGLVVAAFSLVYLLVPNTRVHWRSALVGGVVAGVLWETAGWGFAAFVAGAVNYAAVYSALATLMVFMVWVYVSWLVLLLGASIAFYHQHPQYCVQAAALGRFGARAEEALALHIMAQVGSHFCAARSGLTEPVLLAGLTAPGGVAASVLERLIDRGFVVRTEHDPPRLLPARAPGLISLVDVVNVVRGGDNPGELGAWPDVTAYAPQVRAVVQCLDQAYAGALQGKTVQDLVADTRPPFNS